MENESKEANVAEPKCKEPFTSEESQKVKVKLGMDNLGGQELDSVLKIEGKPDVMVPLGSEKSIWLPVNDVNLPARISAQERFQLLVFSLHFVEGMFSCQQWRIGWGSILGTRV